MSLGSFKFRRPGLKNFLLTGAWMVLVAPLIMAVVAHATLTSATTEANYNLFPVQNTSIQQPLAMLLLSRDDKLFFRAFSDYSDLDGDGSLNTTYTDTFSYAGYFDPDLCYKYDSGQFVAAAQGAGTNGHTCSSQWSGNFLNWVAMSRIDEERYVLYGGRRITDTSDTTVLQRAYIPNDGHAWVKTYTDNGSFTPNSGTYSYCNATIGAAGTDSSKDSTSQPLMRVASGTWASWAASNYTQCQLSTDTVNANDPSKGSEFPSSATDYDVKVKVCSGFSVTGSGGTTSTVMESFCKSHIDDNGVTHYKPEGLLQQFATAIRFGLMTGTWQNPRSGGVLRRNIGLIEGNGGGTCADARNEIDEKTGQFCYIENNTPAMAGIINTLDNFRVYGWTPTTSNNQTYSDCSTFGTQNRQDKTSAQSVPYLKDPGLTSGSNAQACSEWGNPLAGMYAEALRYIQHFDSDHTSVLAPTSTFTSGLTLGGGDTSTSAAQTGGGGDSKDLVPNLPAPKWLDPYSETSGDGGANACSQCNIVVLSTGEPSFDGNSPEVPTVSALPQQAYDATNTIGFNELGTGGASTRQYLFGRMLASSTDGTVGTVFSSGTDSSTDECVQDTVTDLALVRGICPETPSTEGSYYLSGLAYGAWTHDMRPDLTLNGSSAHYIKTYTVQLSEPLPSFDIYTNDGANKITVIPNCTISSSGTATTSSRRCGFMNLKVGAVTNPNTSITYGLNPGFDASKNPYGSYTVYWSDSPYGSHYGISAVQVITYCVGSACTQSSVQAYMCKTQNSSSPVTMPSGGSNICKNGQIQQNLSQLDGQVLVRTETVYHANQYSMALGYTELGKSNTNIKNQLVAGVTGSSVGTFLLGTTGDTGTSTNSIPATGSDWSTPQIQKFPVGPAQQVLLPNPLFLAAKYGGFSYTTGTTSPMPSMGDASDWDAVNNTTGATGQDGLPDNYFYVSDPDQLQTALQSQFNDIVLRAGSGTAAAVVANHVNGIGVAYRSTYLPTVTSSSDATKSISWAGTLDTLWVDSYGLLRENGKAGATAGCSAGCQLSSDYTVDPIVVFTTDATDNHPEFKECVPNDSATFDPSTFSPTNSDVTCSLHELSDLATIWNAESELWGSFSNITTQRTYGTDASTGRYIFTDIYNSTTNKYQQTDFVWSGTSTCTTGFCGSNSSGTVTGNFGYLNTDGSASEAQNIVNWTRGLEVSGMRSRTITTDCTALDVPGCPTTGTSLTMRLGDIVDSTPLVVTSPSENFDLIYGDTSYATFRAKYSDRRQMVYVGANDGMLHAFNGGFFDASKHALYLQPHNQSCDSTGCSADTSITAHPLGSELWAYVPGSLLPHLRWLTDTAYAAGTDQNPGEHVFYVDGSPVATDAKVFANDSTHPGGWGTILVVPFRLGGGDIKVPVPIDSSKSYKPSSCTSANNCKYQESFSSYVVLDVTNPEQAPTVLAELSPASTSVDSTTSGLGTQSYTTSEPAFAVMGEGTSTPHFFMFIGSGPTQAAPQGTAVTSTQPLRIYAYDLACLAGTGTGCPTSPNTPLTIGTNSDGSSKTAFDFSNGGADSHGEDSFAGDLIASDFDLDGNAEAVYFGSVRDPGTSTSPINYTGSLWKISLNGSSDPTKWSSNLMYDPEAPITIRPTLGLSTRGAPMVYAGTGRAFDGYDLETTGQQYIFGMIDPYLLPSGDPQLDFQANPVPSPMIAASDLLDITNIGVCVDVVASSCPTQGALVNSQTGSTTPSGASMVPSDVTTFTQLQALFSCPKTPPTTGSSTCGNDAGKAGFVYDLSTVSGSPSERVISAQALLGGVLVTNTYTPDTSACTALGTGNEYAQDFETGTANPAASMLGVNANGTGLTSVALGPGLPSAPSLHAGAADQSNSKAVTACTQTSTGAIICQKVASVFPVTSGEVSWREPLDQ
jgi:type IV pilus assembly protein PilY1